MKRFVTSLVVVTVLVTATVACTPADQATSACMTGHPVVTLPVDPGQYLPDQNVSLPDGTTIDSRLASYDDTTLSQSGHGEAVKIYPEAGSRNGLCFVGGSISSSLDDVTVPWSTWHYVTGLTVLTPNFEVVGIKIANQGDAISMSGSGATNFKIVGVSASGGPGSDGAYIHDDCVENDSMNAGLVDDAKFDGCDTFMSSIASPGPDGGANLVEVRNTLVRLQSTYNSYNPAKYGYDQHGGFFKWASVPSRDGVAPQLYVHDDVFRADSPAHYGGNANGFLALPPGTRCDHVTLINTQTWPASDLASWTSQCTNVTLGTTADWNAAVATWNQSHPGL